MKKIICIGNRFAYPDNFGMLIYEELLKRDLEGIEVIEGGVGGDSLVLHFEDDAKILIIDYATEDMPKIMTPQDVRSLHISEYNHANAFLYFLMTLEKEYKLYLCHDLFDLNSLDFYIEDILQTVMDL
jgi:Ni,Fe-hydrogenase maturation factor